MICNKCKSPLPDDSEFCQFCGNRIEVHQTATAPVPKAVVVQSTPTPSVSAKSFSSGTTESDKISHERSVQFSQKPRKKSRVLTILLSIVLVLSIAGNIVQFFYQSYHTEDIREQLAAANKTIDDKDESITSYKNKISSQTTTINQQKNEISNLKAKGGYFDDIVSDMRYGNAGYASSNFFASDSVIVVGKNDTDCKFTLTANWSNGGTVEVEYSSSAAWVSFDNDEWYTSTKMTVHPRSKGVTVVTFSNDVDSKTFKVLIIVTD